MIHITQALLDEITKDAEERYPDECCGIMFGTVGEEKKTVLSLRRIENSFGDGEEYHRFLITPEDMLSAELYARANGLDISGFYHSHPDCPAVASEYDRSHALPIYSYIIASVSKGQCADIKSWELVEEKFFEENIIID